MNAALTMVPSQTKITHAIVTVDAPTAARWLAENNGHNRQIYEHRVAKYAGDMSSGRWQFNGESIQFDHSGTLLNGQHRLSAIVRTGIAQPVLIVRGLPSQAQVTMDQGDRRSPTDQLAIAEIDADKTMAAAVRFLIRWNAGLFFGKEVKTSTPEIVEWAKDNPDAIALMRDLSEAGVRHVPCKPSIALAVAYRLAMVDEAEALRFFSALRTGADLTMGDPILALRNRLIGDRDRNVRNPDRDVIAFLVVTWNAVRSRQPRAKIQRPKGGTWTKDNFPEPR